MLPDMQHAIRHRNRPRRKQNISIFNVLNVQVMVHNLEKDNLFEMFIVVIHFQQFRIFTSKMLWSMFLYIYGKF